MESCIRDSVFGSNIWDPLDRLTLLTNWVWQCGFIRLPFVRLAAVSSACFENPPYHPLQSVDKDCPRGKLNCGDRFSFVIVENLHFSMRCENDSF